MVILIPTPYRHNITFYFSLAFLRRRRIAFTADIKPFNFVLSKLSFPSGYNFCFSRKHFLMRCLIFLLPLKPHIEM